MKLIVRIVEAKKKMNTKEELKNTVTFMSTEFKSLETLLKIRPKGTLSKNSFKDENNRLLIIDSWMKLLILGLEFARNSDRIKANNP